MMGVSKGTGIILHRGPEGWEILKKWLAVKFVRSWPSWSHQLPGVLAADQDRHIDHELVRRIRSSLSSRQTDRTSEARLPDGQGLPEILARGPWWVLPGSVMTGFPSTARQTRATLCITAGMRNVGSPGMRGEGRPIVFAQNDGSPYPGAP